VTLTRLAAAFVPPQRQAPTPLPPALHETLARLSVAAGIRDPDAAARRMHELLDALLADEWLRRIVAGCVVERVGVELRGADRC
jgi:hypothetical protein